MARKSTKQARFDALSQRQQRKQLKDKQYTKKADGRGWSDKVLERLNALKQEGETDDTTVESVDSNRNGGE